MAEDRNLCLSGSGITKVFGFGKTRTIAVDHVDFEFHEGEVVSIVGESGSGKTTLAKMLLGLINTTEGEIYFQGKKRDIRSGRKKKEYWKNIQAIFQDPFSAYNTFHKIDAVLMDCIKMRGGGRLPHEQKITMMRDACSFVNLKFAELTKKRLVLVMPRPCESWTLRQRSTQSVPWALRTWVTVGPDWHAADWPSSMNDACSRATILEYLMKLRNETGMTLIFITHDIGLAYYVSDTVYIMERGKFVERGTADEVILRPKQPYTRRLISDVPKIYEEWDLSTV